MFDEHFLSHGKCMHLAPLDYYKNTAMLIRCSKLFQRTATMLRFMEIRESYQMASEIA